MTSKKHNSTLLKLIGFLMSIFVFILTIYIVADPYHIIRDYPNLKNNEFKLTNRNYLSTNLFLKENPKHNFNAFIMGGRTSCAFKTADYSKKLKNSSVFHFDGEQEDIETIKLKLEFIEKQTNEINNVLLIFDTDTFNEHNASNIWNRKDYKFSGENILKYHWHFFKAFYFSSNWIAFFDLKMFGKSKSYMSNEFGKKDYFKMPNNDIEFEFNDSQIKKDSLAYYQNDIYTKRDIYQNLPENMIPHINHIDKKEIEILNKIKAIFRRKKSRYTIIIAPLFDRRNFDTTEVNTLKSIFGEENVHNFSGRNKYTNATSNYYNMAYFKSNVAKEILDEIKNY